MILNVFYMIMNVSPFVFQISLIFQNFRLPPNFSSGPFFSNIKIFRHFCLPPIFYLFTWIHHDGCHSAAPMFQDVLHAVSRIFCTHVPGCSPCMVANLLHPFPGSPPLTVADLLHPCSRMFIPSLGKDLVIPREGSHKSRTQLRMQCCKTSSVNVPDFKWPAPYQRRASCGSRLAKNHMRSFQKPY